MKKSEMIKILSAKWETSDSFAQNALNDVFDLLVSEVQASGKVAVPGFGVFTMRTRSQRVGKNPKTGEPLDIPESKVLGFKMSSGLKSSFN